MRHGFSSIWRWSKTLWDNRLVWQRLVADDLKRSDLPNLSKAWTCWHSNGRISRGIRHILEQSRFGLQSRRFSKCLCVCRHRVRIHVKHSPRGESASHLQHALCYSSWKISYEIGVSAILICIFYCGSPGHVESPRRWRETGFVHGCLGWHFVLHEGQRFCPRFSALQGEV